MSLPKEPRQKMINMMYLVLTALLALNVSTEVLEAFKTVDNSLITSNGSLDNKNKVIYDQFGKDVADPQTKAKAEIWAPKAAQVQKLSHDLATYLDDTKLKLKQESGLRTDADGKPEFKEDDLDAATRLFAPDKFETGEGQKLYSRLQQYKKDVLAVLDPNGFPDEIKNNEKAKKDLLDQQAKFAKTLPLDLSIPDKANLAKTGNDAEDWTLSYFHMTPTIASLTILSKFQNDVKNSEAQMVDYLHQQVGAVKIVYDKFDAITQVNRTYAMPGEDIEIDAGVGAFSDAAKPKITINGQAMPVENGKAVFKTTAQGAGEHSVAVRVEFTKPDGTTDFRNEIVKYTVGTPSGASMFLTKMNVVYLDVDNPVLISSGSGGKENMKVSFSNGSVTSAGGDLYNIKPTGTAGPGKVTINVNGKATSFDVRIKSLPNPQMQVGGIASGAIASALFKAQGGAFVKLKDAEFDYPFTIVSYQIGARNPSGVVQEIAIDGPRWTAASALIQSQAPGSVVYFDKIKVLGPGGKTRMIDGTYYTLK